MTRKTNQRKKLDVSQKQFLYNYLRGTGRSLTPSEAKKKFGIQKLAARISELRSLGLIVRTKKVNNETAYSISSRDIFGSRAHFDV